MVLLHILDTFHVLFNLLRFLFSVCPEDDSCILSKARLLKAKP